MDSYSCPKCGRTAFPGFVLANSGLLIVECPNGECMFQDASLSPADFNKGLAAMPAEGTPDGLGWAGKTVIEVPQGGPVRRAPPPAAATLQPQPVLTRHAEQAPAPSAPAPIVQPRSPGDVIAWIEDRSAWLFAEEARLEGEVATARAKIAGVRAESRRLAKMLRAGRTAERSPVEQMMLSAPGHVAIRTN